MGDRAIKIGDYVRVINSSPEWNGTIMEVIDIDPGAPESQYCLVRPNAVTGRPWEEWVGHELVEPLTPKEHAEFILDQLAEE